MLAAPPLKESFRYQRVPPRRSPGGPGAVAVPVADDAVVAGLAEADVELRGPGAAAVAQPEGAGAVHPSERTLEVVAEPP
jgi:hypothetical protein